MAPKIQTVSTVIFLMTCSTWLTDGQLCKGTCPNYWMQVGDECFRYFGKPMKWHDAENLCVQLGSHLPSIHSQEESNTIYQLWKGLVNHSTQKNSAYWIGLRDTYQEGFYEWTDYTVTTYMNWRYAQPDNSGNEDCVNVINDGDNDDTRQRWNDMKCEGTQAFFCRMPLN